MKLKKLFPILASSTILVGVAAPLFSIVNKESQIKKTNKQIIKQGQFALKQDEVEHFKDQSDRMLASKTYVYYLNVLNYSEEEAIPCVDNVVGQYNTLYNESVQQNKTLLQQGYVGDLDDANYATINMLNKKFDIDPIDYDKIDDNVNNIKQTLLSDGYDSEKIEQDVNNYKTNVEPMIKVLQLDNMSATLLANSYDKESQVKKNLEAISDLIRPQIGSTITVKDDVLSDFASKLAVYSTNGQVGYKTGDEIEANDMGSLFKMQYDNTQGMILHTPAEVDYDNITSPINNASDIKLPYIETKDMNGYSVPGGATWNPGECFPGYRLVARIVNQDFTTDSNVDNITFQLGVRDVNGGEEKWFDSELNQTANIQVGTIQEKRNCANNYYYPEGLKQVPCDTLYDQETDEYFRTDQSKTERSTIEEVLANAPVKGNGEYDISDSKPYFVTSENVDFDGINMPTDEYDGNFKNEKLMFKITDVNTNVFGNHNQSVKGIWSVCDQDPQTGKYNWVKDIPWEGKEGSIWINFNYSEEDLAKLQTATSFCDAVKSTNDFVSKIKNNDIDSADATADQLMGLNVTLDSAMIAASVVCDATMGVMIALAPFSAGAMAGQITLLVLTSAFDIACSVYAIKSDNILVNSTHELHKIKLECDNFNNTFTKAQLKQFNEWDVTLNNPKFNIAGKLAIYDELEKIKEQLGDKWTHFEETYAEINGMDEKEIQKYEAYMNDPKIAYQYKLNSAAFFYTYNGGRIATKIVGGLTVLLSLQRMLVDFSNLESEIAIFANSASPRIANAQTNLTALRAERSFWAEQDPELSGNMMSGLNRDIAANENIIRTETTEFSRLNTQLIEVKGRNLAVAAVCPGIIAVCVTIGILSATAEMIGNKVIK